MMRRLAVFLLLVWPAVAIGQVYDSSGREIVNVETFPDNEPVDLAQIAGSAPGATNPLASRLSDGSAFIVPALDTTLTARFPVGSTPADNESNAVTITRSGAFAFVFDGATWDRWTGAVAQSGTWNITNVSGTVSLPTGAATAANQTTIVGYIDGIESLLGTMDADTSALAGTVAGSEQQVDVVTSALPTGAATSANQLADGHNVTVDNAAGGAAVNIQDGGNTISVDGTVTIETFPDNEPVDVAQMNGVAVTMGNGAAGTGVQRVTIASDSTGQVAVASLPNEGQQTAANSVSVTPDTENDSISATGAAPPGEATYVGGLSSGATGGFLGGIPVCDLHEAVDIVTATTTLEITGVSGRHVYICAINLVTAAANNITVIAGTGATCGTSTAGINGGTTAAEGWNFAANGGIAQGSGLGSIMSTKVSGGATGDSVCIITSAATQLSGTISYTIY